MALPPKIPSTFRRTPIVKRQNSALYSASATKLNSDGAFNNNLSFGVLNNYILRYRSSISITAKLLGLRENVGYAVVREEAARRTSIPMGSRTAKDNRIIGSVNYNLVETTIYRQLIINTVEQLSRQDSIQTRQQINQAVLDNSLKQELLLVIDNISKSTSGIDR